MGPKIFLLASLLMGCTSVPSNQERMLSYISALQKAETGDVADIKHRAATIEKFRFFFKDFSTERVKTYFRDLYAEGAYFRDNVREVKGLREMEDYFARSIEGVGSCKFDIVDVAHSGSHTYIRWIMHLQRNVGGDVLDYVGMSDIIVNLKGMIVFQQDYWDLSELLEEAPLLGRVVSWIKKSI